MNTVKVIEQWDPGLFVGLVMEAINEGFTVTTSGQQSIVSYSWGRDCGISEVDTDTKYFAHLVKVDSNLPKQQIFTKEDAEGRN